MAIQISDCTGTLPPSCQLWVLAECMGHTSEVAGCKVTDYESHTALKCLLTTVTLASSASVMGTASRGTVVRHTPVARSVVDTEAGACCTPELDELTGA